MVVSLSPSSSASQRQRTVTAAAHLTSSLLLAPSAGQPTVSASTASCVPSFRGDARVLGFYDKCSWSQLSSTCVRVTLGADRREARRMCEAHMDTSGFLYASADVFGGKGRGAGRAQPEAQPVAQATDPATPVTHADLVAMEQSVRDAKWQEFLNLEEDDRRVE
ncbi:gag protease polyprotein [Cucumis melo var. makuwa]|uniref:Gag protease polyprotein n=1 Tax=Cucumis melo var. makuwa TaxID=1194695 RepID=A0A5D3CED7_CUCMM|nr:gag protease polyprotein [Cucumis melo var. makuwa]